MLILHVGNSTSARHWTLRERDGEWEGESERVREIERHVGIWNARKNVYGIWGMTQSWMYRQESLRSRLNMKKYITTNIYLHKKQSSSSSRMWVAPHWGSCEEPCPDAPCIVYLPTFTPNAGIQICHTWSIWDGYCSFPRDIQKKTSRCVSMASKNLQKKDRFLSFKRIPSGNQRWPWKFRINACFDKDHW